jgi:two-component system, NtrC family, response regulator HydG
MGIPALLTLESGEARPKSCTLEPEKSFTIGRHRTSHIVLIDEHASRHHAEVFFKGDCWYVRDIGTLNGTRVNGKTIVGRTPLPHDARLQFGRTTLRFTLTSPEPAPWQYVGLDDENSSSFHLKTVLMPDELTVLCQFMTQALKAKGRQELILMALETLQACMPEARVGYMSLEPGEDGQQVIQLSHAADQRMSAQLTHEVQRCRRPVWLREPDGPQLVEESLHSFSDALGLPLGVEDQPIGMLHVYKLRDQFSERTVRFCELLAGHLSHCLHLLRIQQSLRAENRRLRARLPGEEAIIGDSKALANLRQQIERLAQNSSTVLICGESGVGKELVAMALHRQGPRYSEPLVTVNAAAISSTLVESQIFGHRRGAFTGAVADHRGFFEQADGGTLFLDEIGELPMEIQAKLLRVIEAKGFQPVGAVNPIHVNVRVVAATHRDLKKDVEAGRFREDLFYRLQGIRINVPPLREHAEDIPQLVQFFLDNLSGTNKRRFQIDVTALKKLQSFTWPGNVRQLRTAIECAIAFCRADLLREEDFNLVLPEIRQQFADLNLDHIIAAAIRQALEQTKGNVAQAATLLGCSRDTLINRMKKYNITRENE